MISLNILLMSSPVLLKSQKKIQVRFCVFCIKKTNHAQNVAVRLHLLRSSSSKTDSQNFYIWDWVLYWSVLNQNDFLLYNFHTSKIFALSENGLALDALIHHRHPQLCLYIQRRIHRSNKSTCLLQSWTFLIPQHSEWLRINWVPSYPINKHEPSYGKNPKENTTTSDSRWHKLTSRKSRAETKQ